MIKEIILFLSVISVSFPTYRPMSKRTIDFGDNICRYKEYDDISSSFIEYVKPCPEGKYCNPTEGTNNYELSSCETLPKNEITINKSCETKFECAHPNLECSTDKKCVIIEDEEYYVSDSLSNLFISHCRANQIPFSTGCDDVPANTDRTDFNKNIFTKNDITYSVNVFDPYKVKGEIHLKSSDYEVESIDFAYIGSLEVGTPVVDQRACQTGFALYFYGNKKLTPPDNVASPKMYLYCVNLKEVISGDTLKYDIDGTEKIYYTPEIENPYSGLAITYDNSILQTKLEMFKNYKDKLNTMLETCVNDYDYSEPYTCKNDELRKWWYFYNNPDKYMLYKDQIEVVNYLVQQAFPGFVAVDNSRFLSLKYIFCLLLLLAL